MSKRALVISGGGAKGAFAVGAIKALAANAPATTFDIYVGTSTGSLIVPFAAAGALDLLEKMYTTVTTADVIQKGNVGERILADNSLFNADPLARLITQNFNDDFCNKLLASPKEVYLATTCLQTGDSVYFSTKDAPAGSNANVIKAGNPDTFRRAVMASACQPVFMPPIEVEKGKRPMRQYVDGGVRAYAGIQLAVDAGADEIYAILLSPSAGTPDNEVFNDAFTILEHTIDIFTTEVAVTNLRLPMLYTQGLRYIADVKAGMLKKGKTQAEIDEFFDIDRTNPFSGKTPVTIYVVRPDSPLGGGPGGLNFIPDEMKGMLAKGVNSMSDLLAHLPPNGSNMV